MTMDVFYNFWAKEDDRVSRVIGFKYPNMHFFGHLPSIFGYFLSWHSLLSFLADSDTSQVRSCHKIGPVREVDVLLFLWEDSSYCC